MTNGVAGYCNQGSLAAFSMNGNDIFDGIAQANGVNFDLGGELQINSSGRSSTSTGSLSFDEGKWEQAAGFIDYFHQNAPNTGYGTITTYSGTESASARTFADNLQPLSSTNILGNFYIDGTLAIKPVFHWPWETPGP
jgi:hypothetical protein